MKKKGFTPLEMCKNLGNRLRLRNWSRSMLNIYALSDASEAHPALLNVFRQRTQPYHVRRNEQRNLSTYDEKQGSPMGLTLIEILVVLFIMGFIAISLYYVLDAGIESWRAGKERTDIIAQARVAMDRLTRELRATGGIEAAEDTYIYFSTDLDADGTETHIYYSWPGSGISLLRKEGAGTYYSIAMSIDDFSFTYYSTEDDLSKVYSLTPGDGDTNTQAERNRIWMIEIKTKIKRGGTGEEAEVDLRSTVQPRNYSYTD